VVDPEIEAIRAQLAAHPRPENLAERRKRLDALGTQYVLPAHVRVEPETAPGVPAEWTTTPGANLAHVILSLHGGGYTSGSLDSHRHTVTSFLSETSPREQELADLRAR
jgi:epsilon-lactone hydrolase